MVNDNVALKPIRFENMHGQLLVVCEDCSGSGLRATAERETESPSGKKHREKQEISGHLIRMFQRNGWGVRSHECTRCKGAGTHLADEKGGAQ